MTLVRENIMVKFNDTWITDKYGRGYAHVTELVPVSILKNFREYDRSKKTFNTKEYVEQLKQELIDRGIEDQIMLEYNPKNGYARIGEGNHRLAIAIQLGVTHLPVRVSRNYYIEPDPERKHGGAYVKNPKILLKTYKGHINSDYKPSDIFDINDFYDQNQFKRHIITIHQSLIKENNMDWANKLFRFFALKEKIVFKDDFSNGLNKLMRDIHWMFFNETEWNYENLSDIYSVR